MNTIRETQPASETRRAIERYTQELKSLTRQDVPVRRAEIHNKLGNLYADQTATIERAIEHYNCALEVRTRAALPERWAETQWNLALTYRLRKEGKREENLERAIELLEAAGEVHTREAFPVDWAAIQNILGLSYFQRLRGEEADNIEKAIRLYEAALQIRTRSALPKEWSITQWNLALAYQNRKRGKREDNLERAIKLYGAALEIRSREEFPKDWSQIQHNLGMVYDRRILGEKADNLEKAIELFGLALEIRTRGTLPEEWATTQFNLADAYGDRIRGNRAENLERAIESYELSLEIRTREDFPEKWAVTVNDLAVTYSDRILGERADNLDKAIELHLQSLDVYTRDKFPEDWAMAQCNLANAYKERVRGDSAGNLEAAIERYQAALDVYSRDQFPEDWAMTQLNLANAVSDRIRGDRAENLELAIRGYGAALEVYSRDKFPEDWALTQSNLALSYRVRIQGEAAENREKAIALLTDALEVRTRNEHPEEWASTQSSLALAYTDRILGERADNLASSIKHHEAALEVYTRDAFPLGWARVQYNLAGTYESAGNRDKAIELCSATLAIYARDALPTDYRQVQSRLGRLLFDQREWVRAHAAYTEAIEATQDQLARFYTESGRRAEVGETGGIYVLDAFCLLRLGKPAEALLRLELGRTRLLSEALALSDLDVSTLPAAEQALIGAAQRSIREIEAEMRRPSRPDKRRADGADRADRSHGDERAPRASPVPRSPRSDRELAELLQRARADIRGVVGRSQHQRPDFMHINLSLQEVLRLIPEGGALVSVAVTSRGSAVFAIPHGATTATSDHLIQLGPDVFEPLRRVLEGGSDESKLGWIRAYNDYRSTGTSSPYFKSRWLTTIESTCEELWNHLMGPIHLRLKSLGLGPGAPVVLLLQGWLRLFPLHAACRTVNGVKRFFLDDWTVAYAPSCHVLGSSHQRLTEPERKGRALFAVSNPEGNLGRAAHEVDAIRGFFDTVRILEKLDAKVEAVLNTAPGCQYLHLSCHGSYDWQDPMQSGLRLADGMLTLSDIDASLDLSASRLVTLSACETGITDTTKAPEEFVGLQAGFLQAGAPAVVSTLWAVNAGSTELLVARFYKNLFGNSDKDALAPALAMREAQRWLRDATLEDLDSSRNAPAIPTSQSTERPFSHPYHWAAFVFSGPHLG